MSGSTPPPGGDTRPRVLFLCTGNSCRSQMAEGFLRELAGDRVRALSAGVDPHGLHPRAVATMRRHGVDIGGQTSDDIREYLDDPPDLVVSVCDHAAESCPTFPGRVRRAHWPFRDPAKARGSDEEIERVFEEVAVEIRERLARWLAEGAPPLALAS